MAKYHPDERFLTDYAAGSLPIAQALCVATHLHYCGICRARVRELTELGSSLFMLQERRNCQEDAFERLMLKVDTLPPRAAVPIPATPAAPVALLPRPLHKLARGNLDSLPWNSVGRSVRYSRLKTGDHERETSLLHIMAGGNVPHHRHEGDEITVVIRGSFSDHDDRYGVGDFVVRTSGEPHRPRASRHEDCLCLATLDKPIVISSFLHRLLAPLF